MLAEKALVKLKIAAIEEFAFFSFLQKKFSTLVSRVSANPKNFRAKCLENGTEVFVGHEERLLHCGTPCYLSIVEALFEGTNVIDLFRARKSKAVFVCLRVFY